MPTSVASEGNAIRTPESMCAHAPGSGRSGVPVPMEDAGVSWEKGIGVIVLGRRYIGGGRRHEVKTDICKSEGEMMAGGNRERMEYEWLSPHFSGK